MTATRPVVAELHWAGFVVIQWAVLTVAGLAASLLWEVEGARAALQEWEPRVRGLVWLTILVAIPLLGVVASVLLHAWARGVGFRSRRARLRFHAVACYAATLLFMVVLALAQQMPIRVWAYPLVAATVPASALLLFVYWPRLVFPTLTGLAPDADEDGAALRSG